MKSIALVALSLALSLPAFATDLEGEAVFSVRKVETPEENAIIIKDGNLQTQVSYSYQFRNTPLHTRSVSHFRIFNHGSSAIYVESVALEGRSYTASNRCSRILLPGRNCFIAISFTPKGSGTHSGRLDIDMTGAQNIHIYLSGRSFQRKESH